VVDPQRRSRSAAKLGFDSGPIPLDHLNDASCRIGVVREPRPRLVTLRGAQVGALTVSIVDLRACRFFGVHGLESLTLEASCEWPRAPLHGRCDSAAAARRARGPR
jgi:hypothetical protein